MRRASRRLLPRGAREWENQREDESYIPQVLHEVLSVTEAQMLESVVPGLDETCFWRQRECRSVFRKVDWIHNLAAATTSARRAGSSTGLGWTSRAKANNIWVTDLKTGCIADPSEVSRGANPELQCRVTPIMWADSTVESLLGRTTGITSGILQQLQDCPAQDRMHLITSHLNAHSGMATGV